MNKTNEFDWLILFMISGFGSMLSLFIYTLSGNMMALYFTGFLIVLFIFSAAKSNLFNVFGFIRKTPKNLWSLLKELDADYMYWRKNGKRKT